MIIKHKLKRHIKQILQDFLILTAKYLQMPDKYKISFTKALLCLIFCYKVIRIRFSFYML